MRSIVYSVLFFLVFPSVAQARRAAIGSSTIVRTGFTACGCPLYTKKTVIGYDRCGHPILRASALRVNHRCHRNQTRYQSRRFIELREPCVPRSYRERRSCFPCGQAHYRSLDRGYYRPRCSRRSSVIFHWSL